MQELDIEQSNRIAASTFASCPTRGWLASLTDERRREQSICLELPEELHGGMVALLLDLFELAELESAILHTRVSRLR